MNLERGYLLVYVLLVIALTSWHAPLFHVEVLLLALLLSGEQRSQLLRKSFFALLLFNGSVSLSYALLAWWQDTPAVEYLLRLNLRVFTLTYLSFLLAARVNLFKALSFSKDLSYLLMLAYAQIGQFRQLLEEFRLAWRSRRLRPLSWRQKQRQAGAFGLCLLDKSLQRSEEMHQAMRSRGFFNDNSVD